MNKETVLSRIKKIIEDNNLTNSEFAEKIGVPKSSWAASERLYTLDKF